MRLILRPYRLVFRRPFATGFGLLREREGILVGLEAGGLQGWGEAAPLPGFGGEALADAARMLVPLQREALSWPEVADGKAIAQIVTELAERWPGCPCARAAVEQALADLAARRAGEALWGWWGSREAGTGRGSEVGSRGGGQRPGQARGPARTVGVNGVIGGAGAEVLAAEARAAVAAGYRVLKVKLLGEGGEDVARLRAVRAAVGGGVGLRADANGSWSLAEAESILGQLQGLGLEYVEQPLAPGNDAAGAAACLRGMAELRRLGVPLAADESLLRPGGVEAVLQGAAADQLILKPQLLGGLSRAASIAAAAAERGLGVTMTSALDGAVGVMGVLQLTAALRLGGSHGLATGGLFERDLAAVAEVQGGEIRLPDGPGLGLDPVDDTPF